MRVPQIPGYTIERELGRGSYGVVYLARNEADGQLRALKVLTDTRGFDDARFELEHAVLRSVHHPGLINVYEKGRYGEVHYYAMDYCPGPTLKEQAGKRDYSPRQAALLVAKLADAAGHIHKHGIVHRDIKPANVFVLAGQEPEVRIMDFGLAKLESTQIEASNCALTAAGEIVGSPAYMAPECVSNDEIDGRTDLYSFGILFFELLTGQLPIQAESAQSFLTAHLVRPPLTLAEAAPHVRWPPALEELVADLLGKVREERPASCKEALARLDALISDLDSSRVDRDISRAEPGTRGGFGFRGLLGRLRGRGRG